MMADFSYKKYPKCQLTENQMTILCIGEALGYKSNIDSPPTIE